MDKVLVTGAAGFIGFHLCKKLISEGYYVFGIDNLNNYYDLNIKKARIKQLENLTNGNGSNFTFSKLDLTDNIALSNLFSNNEFKTVCHLAAQAGVRYSLEYPQTYVDNNIAATVNLLEKAKEAKVKDVVFASTSSVYGLSKEMPFSEETPINSTISTYSATKYACELLCHTYHKIYGLRFRILRFFTVYGPWGRPDMALFKFTKAIIEDKPIRVFNNGNMKRDFTYVDDIVAGFLLSIKNKLPFEVFNLGNGKTVSLLSFIEIIESNLGKKAKKVMEPMQPGDVSETWANVDKARNVLGYSPNIDVEVGVINFIKWYKEYYDIV